MDKDNVGIGKDIADSFDDCMGLVESRDKSSMINAIKFMGDNFEKLLFYDKDAHLYDMVLDICSRTRDLREHYYLSHDEGIAFVNNFYVKSRVVLEKIRKFNEHYKKLTKTAEIPISCFKEYSKKDQDTEELRKIS